MEEGEGGGVEGWTSNATIVEFYVVFAVAADTSRITRLSE
jgi:hypothetical protein